jgi:outer membrane protein insertion porin family
MFALLAVFAIVLTAPLVRAQPSPPIIDAVDVSGNSRVESDAIKLHISQQPGQPLNEAAVDQDIKAIYRMGFFSRVSATVERSGGRNVLVYQVQEQPMVADVRFEGFKAVSSTDDKITAAIKIHSGSLLDPSLVQESIRNIKQVYESHSYPDARVDVSEIPRAGNTVLLIFRVTEGPKVHIAKVNFTGNAHFKASTLESVIETAPYGLLSWATGTGILDHKKLTTDNERLTAFYYDHGYLNAHFSEPTVTRVGNSFDVTFHVDEGPIYKVGAVDFSGDLKFPKKELAKQLTIKSGETFRGSHLQHDLLTLSDFYSNLGYAYVSVDPRTNLDPSNHTVDINFNVTPGKEVLVDRINISGNTKTADKVIRREMRIQEQEPYSAQKIKESKARLDQLGFFSQTHITTSPAPQPDAIDLNVNVQEANTASFQLGGGFDSGSSLFGNFTLGDRNLFGGGESLMFNAMVGFLFQNFGVTYTEPWFLDMPLATSLSLFDNESYLISFNQKTAGFGIQTYYPLEELGFRKIGPLSLKYVNAGLSYQFESVGITGLSPLTPYAISQYKGYRTLSILTPSLRRFTVDNPIDPRTGSVFNVNLELALGGGSQYAKTLIHWRYFWNFVKSPEWGSWVYSPSVTFGIGTSLQGGTGGEMPVYARFFPGGLGGGGDVRGYQVFSLGPEVITYDQQGQPINTSLIGGSKELLLSQQISFPLLTALGIRGFVFTDAGNAYRLHAAMPLDSLQASYGIGIFWRSPFGPISVDVARPMNPRPNDQTTTFDVGAGTL